jgi:hypothetical protein
MDGSDADALQAPCGLPEGLFGLRYAAERFLERFFGLPGLLLRLSELALAPCQGRSVPLPFGNRMPRAHLPLRPFASMCAPGTGRGIGGADKLRLQSAPC